jgi:hypothetical protein
MALSKAQRRRINRQNAQRSTGPRTDRGKEISSLNSLKHGLCIEKIALPTEDAAVLRDRLDRWNEFYLPGTPGESELIEMAVTSSVQRRRALEQQAAAVSERVRTAEKRWDEDREDEVARLEALLENDPAAVRALRRNGHGCRWLIGRWERLGALLEKDGFWDARDRDEAIRLQGAHPDRDRLDGSTDVALTHRICAALNPSVNFRPSDPGEITVRDVLLYQMSLDQAPPLLDKDAWIKDPAKGRGWLRDKVAGQLAELREREGRLRREYDEPERAEAASRALVLEGPSGANLMRYERMHELAFHRAYGALLKGRKEAAETGLAPGAPDEAIEDEDQDANPAEEGTSGPDPARPSVPPPGPASEVSALPKALAQAMVRN